MKILVTHGSQRGGTAEIAERIADTLRNTGLDVDCIAAREVRDVRPYDRVIVGGALYAFEWHADARQFVLRHAKALRDREVWCFSSGPLDDSAARESIPPVPHVAELMAYVCARGHATFGGRMLPDAKGFPASAMAKKNAGDWRDWDRIEAWARTIALSAPAAPRGKPVPLPSRTLPLALCAFTGITAMAGGIELCAYPHGSPFLPLSLLAHSAFHSFYGPGFLLFTCVGALNAWAAWRFARRTPYAPFWGFAGGSSLTIWLVTEVIMLRTFHWLHAIYFAVALMTLWTTTARIRRQIGQWSEQAKKIPKPGPSTHSLHPGFQKAATAALLPSEAGK